MGKSLSKTKKKKGFKSKLEKDFAGLMFCSGLAFSYEPDRFAFVTQTHYTPDFKIKKNVYIETKGYFSPSNRSRLLSFREQFPQIQIYLMFQRADNYLDKKSKTTYAQWCDQHGFKWADIRKGIPKHWWK